MDKKNKATDIKANFIFVFFFVISILALQRPIKFFL